jgi:membrane protease subunit (stomatin/prohibitin family)
MGMIRAALGAAKGTFADQWLDVVEPLEMGERTLFTRGVVVRQGSNKKGNKDILSNGSVIHVYDNQCMILTDGGKIIDYSAEPGYYTVDHGSAPSLFHGDLPEEVLEDSFNRFKFGGGKPVSMKAFFINLQEIRGFRFGTRNAVNYFDSFYNAELFLRAHGTYSLKITDPIRFYTEVVPKNAETLEAEEISEQFLNEFLEAFQTAVNQMSVDGIRISFVTSKTGELSRYMAHVLDEEWKRNRGVEIQSVGIASLSYDETSQKLINMRNQGAMMGDPAIREGYLQSAVAQGLQNAGSNPNGAMPGYLGMGFGMQGAGGFLDGASRTNREQMARGQMAGESSGGYEHSGYGGQPGGHGSWNCSCGTVNRGNFCSNCGRKRPDLASWTCSCGAVNTGNFCSNCGKPRS